MLSIYSGIHASVYRFGRLYGDLVCQSVHFVAAAGRMATLAGRHGNGVASSPNNLDVDAEVSRELWKALASTLAAHLHVSNTHNQRALLGVTVTVDPWPNLLHKALKVWLPCHASTDYSMHGLREGMSSVIAICKKSVNHENHQESNLNNFLNTFSIYTQILFLKKPLYCTKRNVGTVCQSNYIAPHPHR